jgi:hypothetical protein
MAAVPVFAQDGALDIYWLAGAPAIAYLPSAGSDFPGQITLDQAWADKTGVYLFLDQRPADVAAMLPELTGFVSRLGTPGALRMVWLTTAGLPPSSWQAATLQLAQPLPSPPAATLGQTSIFGFQPYSLLIGTGTAVAQAGEADGWGFTLTPTAGAAFLWQGDTAQLPVDGGIALPFSGPTAGCLAFALPVPDFTAFGAGVSYFYEDTAETDLPPVDGVVPRVRTGYARSLMLPILAGGLTGTLAVTLDPTRPLDSTRTAFSFPLGAGSTACPSMLASPRGHDVALAAHPGSAGAAGGRFIFQTAPVYSDPNSTQFTLHVVPDGVFTLEITPPQAVLDAAAEAESPPWTPAERLICGMSGIEYAGLPQRTACRIVFSGGHPAFAPGAAQGVPPPEATTPLVAFGGGLVATTAWASALPPVEGGGVVNYFAQPEQAPLYGTAPVDDLTQANEPPPAVQSFLYFTELPSAQLGAGDSGPVFPLAPYRRLDPTRVDDARRVEAAGIAPARRQQILPPEQLGAAVAATPTRSVTPQGLVVDWDYSDPTVWTDVVLGNDVDPVSGHANLLQLTSVHGALRTALQTNRLFLIGACPGVFARGGSVAYGPGPDTFAALIAGAPDDPVWPAVSAWYESNDYPQSHDEAVFRATVESIPGVTVDEAHFVTLRQVSGLLRAEISGWRFQFSPWSWTQSTDETCSTGLPGTMMLMKFAPGKLSDLAADPATWTWAQVATFGGSTNPVRVKLNALIEDARTRRAAAKGGVSPYDHFLDQVVDNPNWSGVLVLGCPIPLDELPGPLQCLAAGIDPSRFAAHHVGLNATAFQVGPGGIQLSQTSMFGLIDYQDDKELHLDPTPGASFAYKVQSLTVQFANSAISGFASRVALLAPRLFGSTVTLRDTQRGNSILMDGVFQKPADATSDADGSYVFKIVEENLYDVSDSVISTIAIRTAEFSTIAPADAGDPAAIVRAQFRLGGGITFQDFEAFDILSYGPAADGADPASQLDFRSLLINLSFPLYAPETPPVFAEEADKLTTDAASVSRTQSLVNRFPVRLSGLIGVPYVGGQAPADMGFVPADTPIANSRIEAPWWGVVYELDLGTTGALSSASALTMTVVAAWAGKGPRDETPPLYVGVRLPGLKELVGASLPFESFLRLGFRNIKFTAYDTDKGDRAYLMRFRRFSISALGVSFPPGNIDVVLFGNPSGDKNKVGWYAAYAADEDDKKKLQASPDRLRLAARRGAFGRG